MTTPIQKRTYTGVVATDHVRDVGIAVSDALAAAGQPPLHRECFVVPGDIAWDECECGQLAQSITSVAPSSTPPAPVTDSRNTPCGPGMAVVNVTLSLTRCVPVMNNDGVPPSCEDLDAAAVMLEIDREITRRAVVCHLRGLERTYVISSYGVNLASTVGPNGMCAGIQLTYWFALSDSCC